MRRALAVAVPAVVLAAAGCGGAKHDRLDERTPGTGPARTATAAPTRIGRPVTAAEDRVIRGWADALRHGRVAAAAGYFALPAVVSNASPPLKLSTRKEVLTFNRTLPCGAKVVRTERSVHDYVVATFKLTERTGPGARPCGDGLGAPARTAFLIRRGHIVQWVRLPEDPAATGGGTSSTS